MASNSRPANAHRVNGQCGPGRKTGKGLAHNASRQPTPVRAAGSRTPRQAMMPIRREPYRPNAWQLQDAGRRFPPHYLHQSWLDYLYWDIELEP